jgi:hypothetical protein
VTAFAGLPTVLFLDTPTPDLPFSRTEARFRDGILILEARLLTGRLSYWLHDGTPAMIAVPGSSLA